jgi:hypothetical protein
MSILLVVIFVMCMFAWLMSALPFPQTAPFAWVHPLVAWIAVAILGYAVLGGAGEGMRRVGALVIHSMFG